MKIYSEFTNQFLEGWRTDSCVALEAQNYVDTNIISPNINPRKY